MSSITELVNNLKSEWDTPRIVKHNGRLVPFPLVCIFANPSPPFSLDCNTIIQNSMNEFWAVSEYADLFKDDEYGQWGLRLLSPKEVVVVTNEYVIERENDAFRSDLVVGKFYGDSDLLVMRNDPSATDYGSLLVASPLDPRADWEFVSDNLENFLNIYVEANGAKFWET